MKYKVDVNDEYYLEIEKAFKSGSNGSYVQIVVFVFHKTENYKSFRPFCTTEDIPEYKFFSNRTWGERVNKVEKKMINKAKENITKLPNLQPYMEKKFN